MTDASLKELTEVAIKKLLAKPPADRREVPDRRIAGLYFIVQPSGASSWALRYRTGGATRKLTLGAYPLLGLAAARRKAEEERGKLAVGQDPARAKRAAKEAIRAEREAEGDKVERVVDLFVERYAKPHTRDWAETQRLLNRNIVDRWRGRRLSQIGRADVHNLLDEIVDRAPIAANRVFAQFRKMCRWAVARGIVERTPCDGVAPPSSEKGRARERVLSDDELRLAWRAADTIAWPFGPIVKLLILTGARRDEIAEMRWSEVDLERAIWTLPAERSKNRRANEIPLTAAALDLLRSLPKFDRADLVFSTTGGRSAVSGFSRAKRAIDTAIEEMRLAEARGEEPEAIPDWVLHDLRRTVATGLQQLGVRLEVTEAILNHVSGSRAGVVGVYQRYSWAEEKRAALNAWARRVEAILSGTEALNVVELPRARA
jgi:integrase